MWTVSGSSASARSTSLTTLYWVGKCTMKDIFGDLLHTWMHTILHFTLKCTLYFTALKCTGIIPYCEALALGQNAAATHSGYSLVRQLCWVHLVNLWTFHGGYCVLCSYCELWTVLVSFCKLCNVLVKQIELWTVLVSHCELWKDRSIQCTVHF